MQLQLNQVGINFFKALASDTRVKIIHLLSNQPATVSEIAKKLNLSKAIISRHVQILEAAHIIRLTEEDANYDNRKKTFSLAIDHAEIDFPTKLHLPYEEISYEIKLGYYSDFSVEPTCGLASYTKIIGKLDDPRTFVSNDRTAASLLWFGDGYVEYLIPNFIKDGYIPKLLELSLELSSEFPDSNDNWASDIFFAINDVHIGTWTVPGNYSDVRGTLTPEWWDDSLSQYGNLKHLRVSQKDTGIDGHHLSYTVLDDLALSNSPFIKIRIGVDPKGKNKGGLTIFGKDFGNHPQNILLKIFQSQT